MDMKKRMNIKKIFKICLCINLVNYYVLADEEGTTKKQYCELNNAPVSKSVKVNDFPSYFFKVHPSGDYIAYIGPEGNQLLDLNSGVKYPLPGGLDPTFTPDGEHLLVPMHDIFLNGPVPIAELLQLAEDDNNENFKTGMAFYKFDGFTKALKEKDKSKERVKKLHSKPLLKDDKSEGVYQSSSIDKDGQLKVITDSNGVSIKSYKETNQGIEGSSEIKKLCDKTEGFQNSIPMISKDGKFISTYNGTTKSTQIFQIKEDGKCNLALDLGIATGKVSFNWDSSQITFHIDHFAEGFGNYFSGVASDINKDVYVLNLDTLKEGEKITLKPSTWAKVTNHSKTGDGSYYPGFSKDGDIFFLSDIDNYFEFSQVKQADLDFKPFYKLPYLDTTTQSTSDDTSTCIKLNESLRKPFLLGQLWSGICKNIELSSFTDSVLLTMGMNQENCKDLVRKEWNQVMISKIKAGFLSKVDMSFVDDINIEDLLAACPGNDDSIITPKVIGQWKKRDKRHLGQIIKQKCIACHTKEISYEKKIVLREYRDEKGKKVKSFEKNINATFPALDINKIDYKLSKKLLAAIGNPDPNKRMPKEGALSRAEVSEFYKYYQLKSLEQPSQNMGNMDDYPMIGFMYSDAGLEEELKKYIKLNEEYLSGLSDKEKVIADQKRDIWCQYGQHGCKALIDDLMVKKKKELMGNSNNLDDAKKKELDFYVLGLKCRFCFEVTNKECKKVWNPES